MKKIFLLALILFTPLFLSTNSHAVTIEFETSAGASFTWTTNNAFDTHTNFNVGVFHFSSITIDQALTHVPGQHAVFTVQLGGSGWTNTDPTQLNQTLKVTVLSGMAAGHGNLLTGEYEVSGSTTKGLVISGANSSIIKQGGAVVGSVVGYPGTATFAGFEPFTSLGFTSTFAFGSTVGTFAPSLSLTTEVPEPSTLLLLGFGLAGLALSRIYRKKH